MKKLLFIVAVLPMIAFGQIPDPKPNTYVNDFAGVLSSGKILLLNQQIKALEQKYSVQLAVILINELPPSMEIEDYAREIGRKWHVGNAKNGLVYVAAIKAHKQRLEVARELEGTIPDITATHLLEETKPFFRQADYFTGITQLIAAIDKTLQPAQKEQQSLASAEKVKKAEKDDTLPIWIIILIILLIAAFVVVVVWFFFNGEEDESGPVIVARDPPAHSDTNSLLTGGLVGYELGRSQRSSYDRDDTDYYSRSHWSPSNDDSSSRPTDTGESFGDWGSGSSDSGSSSSDSGFSGGGGSSDW